MYELLQVGENTFTIECPAKMGIYQLENNAVYLIDSGNDKEAAKKVLKILEARQWTLKGIINTHSNSDHIGGNAFLQEKTNCQILSTGLENVFIQFPILEPAFLYGGYPFKALHNKFLKATPSQPTGDVRFDLPVGLEWIDLGGHFFDMVGIRTSDDVVFLGDCVFSEAILNKYHLAFLYDVSAFLKTLDFVESLSAKLFVPAHAAATMDIKPLVKINRDKVMAIIQQLMIICQKPIGFDEILKSIFDVYELSMDSNQYVLVGSTIRSYLSYLLDGGQLRSEFIDNRMLWKR